MEFKFLSPHTTLALTALRIAAGLVYFTHGTQKLFGWFGGFGEGGTADLMSRFGAAGVIETVAGIGITLGLFTRLFAFIASGEMAVAYFWMHMMVMGSGKIWWWENRGEVVMLLSFIFLYFAARGPGPVSIDAKLDKRGAPSA